MADHVNWLKGLTVKHRRVLAAWLLAINIHVAASLILLYPFTSSMDQWQSPILDIEIVELAPEVLPIHDPPLQKPQDSITPEPSSLEQSPEQPPSTPVEILMDDAPGLPLKDSLISVEEPPVAAPELQAGSVPPGEEDPINKTRSALQALQCNLTGPNRPSFCDDRSADFRTAQTDKDLIQLPLQWSTEPELVDDPALKEIWASDCPPENTIIRSAVEERSEYYLSGMDQLVERGARDKSGPFCD